MYPTARRELIDVVMPDGVALATSVSLPEPDFRGPVVLVRSPYPFLSFAESTLGLDIAEMLASGFAVVRQDVRGRGGSGGTFSFLAADREDGRATIAWMREQDWSDGRVAMLGGSYLGRVQLLVGEAPGLGAIAPALCGLGSDSTWRPHGVLSLSLVGHWLRLLVEMEPRALSAADAGVVRGLIERGDPLATLAAVRDATHPAHRLMESFLPMIEGAPVPELTSAPPRIPSLHVTGWYDHTAGATIDAWQRSCAADAAAGRHHLIVGPWTHVHRGDELQGRHHPDGSGEALGLPTRELDFLRHAVLGEGEPQPAAHVYVTGANEWRVYPDWPPPATHELRFLDASTAGLVAAAPAVGTLELDGRAAAPVPAIGGPTLDVSTDPDAVPVAGPADVSSLLARDDVLALRSEPLATDLELAGTVALELTATSDRSPAGVAVKLAEAAPDGTLRVVTDGAAQAPTDDGQAVTLRIAMSPVHHVVTAGSALVLLIAGSEFPRYELGLDGDRTLRFATGGATPSRLLLPVVA